LNRKTIYSIVAIIFGRLVINITKRFAYPFVSAIARNFAVPVESIQNVIALSNGTGLLSPILGTISERYGRKPVMLGLLIMMSLMSFVGAIFSNYGVFILVMFAFGIGKIIYDPTFQSYLGDVVPFNRRARVMGFGELSWAFALVIAAPAVGFLLDTTTMQSVFIFMGIALTLGSIGVWLFTESDVKSKADRQAIKFISPVTSFRIISQHPPAIFSLIFAICLTFSHELFFINYGLWMEQSFDLVLTALGTVTIVIAVAEIVGEFIVITIADRIGTKLTSMSGMLVAAIMFAIIPFLSFSLPIALFGIFVMFVGIETAIVASFPLFTEILPNARAIMMSANMGAHSLGRVLGAAVGGIIYATTGGDFLVVGTVASVIGTIAFIVMWRFIPIGQESVA
jgi:MFS transporter, DHA1 family, inner membrane transport protein